MINASEQVRTWERYKDWFIAPANVGWIDKGAWVKMGEGVKLGHGVKLGDWVTLGNGVTLGDRVTLGTWVTLDDGVTLGDEVTLGEGAHHLLNLGYADGYYKNACLKDNVVYISAGCHYFTLQKAIEHWSNHSQDREETLCLLESIKALADKRGYYYK